jgi:hypothetical protein
MPPDLTDHLARLRSLAAREGYTTAVKRLGLALEADRHAACRRHLIEALPHVRLLPRSLRRLAWLEVFGAPERRRSRAVKRVEHLWNGGIGRSLEDLTASTGVAELLALCGDPSIDVAAALLGTLARLDAFSTLAADGDISMWTTESIELALRADSDECRSIAEAAHGCGLLEIAVAASTARWIRSMLDPDAPPAPPSSGDLPRQVLLVPSLRGPRRAGARAHGRRIGERVLGESLSAARGARKTLDIGLPLSFNGEPGLRTLLAPLVRDLLSKAATEVTIHRDRQEGVEILARNAPKLVTEAAAAIEPDGLASDAEESSRAEWLGRIVGLAVAKP